MADPDLSWMQTAATAPRFRRHYVIALCAHLGLSSRFIADAFDLDDSATRRILRSETVRAIRRAAFGRVSGSL